MKKSKTNFVEAAHILRKAGVKLPKDFNERLLKNNSRYFQKRVHDLLLCMCSYYGYKIPIKEKAYFKKNFYESVFNKIVFYNNIDTQIFKLIMSLYLPKELERMQQRHLKKALGKEIAPENIVVIGGMPAKKFYQSKEWRSLRYYILEKYGNKCQCCGRSPDNGITIHVDHIKPRSLFPELALNPDNMQILCEDCNLGKSNKFTGDWRQS